MASVGAAGVFIVPSVLDIELDSPTETGVRHCEVHTYGPMSHASYFTKLSNGKLVMTHHSDRLEPAGVERISRPQPIVEGAKGVFEARTKLFLDSLPQPQTVGEVVFGYRRKETDDSANKPQFVDVEGRIARVVITDWKDSKPVGHCELLDSNGDFPSRFDLK